MVFGLFKRAFTSAKWLTQRKKRHETWTALLWSSHTEAPLASWFWRRADASTYWGHMHIQTQRSNWCHISCQYSKFFLSSTPTKGSSLFNIMKPQREAAGLCRSIWRRHRWLPGRTLDPSNWLWRQREMDKWEAPPEWPDDWGRNEEACWASHGNPGESQGLVFGYSNFRLKRVSA